MIELFNNRELSLIFWLSIVILYSIIKSKPRKALLRLVKAFFNQKIIDVFLLMIICVELSVLFLTIIGFWETFLIKDTILWTLFAAFPLIVQNNTFGGRKVNFSKILKDSIKIIIIIEFITNFYNFSFLIELILIPLTALLFMLEAFSKDNIEHKNVNVLIKVINAIFGLIICIYTFRNLSIEPDGFLNIFTLKNFLFPIIITFLFIPFLYFINLFSKYEKAKLKF